MHEVIHLYLRGWHIGPERMVFLHLLGVAAVLALAHTAWVDSLTAMPEQEPRHAETTKG